MVFFAYGNADFADIRRSKAFYVDKTPFLPLLESPTYGGKHLLFLRPRRFGKSSLLSMMAHYYDASRANEYDELFSGLWIHEHPTPEKNRYLVLHLNFSTITASGDEHEVRANFLSSIRNRLKTFVERYRIHIPSLESLNQRMDGEADPAALMDNFVSIIAATQEKLYVLIDEYDTFANALLSAEQKDLYEKITDKFGFVRAFYRVLKAGADSSVVGRVFITGGTPILIDDLMTGFNIVTNISNKPRFNALAGFTRTDVERAVDAVLGEMPDVSAGIGDRSALLETLERFYDGYRFSRKSRERMFNSTLVVYCLRELADSGEYPENMLDPNARTDYQKLHSLWASAGPAAEERREVLEQILAEGQVTSPLVNRFGVRTTTTTGQFVSLMYYTGMLTLAPEEPMGDFYTFVPPNRVIRELSWEHYTRLLEDLHRVPLIGQPIGLSFLAMLIDGNMQPFLTQLRKNILPVLSVRDLRKHDEKAMKMLLIGALVTSNLFYVLNEKEFAQGFNDLFVTPVRTVHQAKYAWMFELKYVATDADEATKNAALEQAEVQLQRYSSDPHLVPMLTRGLGLKAGTLLFVGGKEVMFREFVPAT